MAWGLGWLACHNEVSKHSIDMLFSIGVGLIWVTIPCPYLPSPHMHNPFDKVILTKEFSMVLKLKEHCSWLINDAWEEVAKYFAWSHAPIASLLIHEEPIASMISLESTLSY